MQLGLARHIIKLLKNKVSNAGELSSIAKRLKVKKSEMIRKAGSTISKELNKRTSTSPIRKVVKEATRNPRGSVSRILASKRPDVGIKMLKDRGYLTEGVKR